MDPGAFSTADVDKLSPSDKVELGRFVDAEQQRAKIQAQTHTLTDLCFKKCVTSSIRSSKLEKGEEGCMASCVERFLDVNVLVMKHLQELRQG